jgi:hypothetical protein
LDYLRLAYGKSLEEWDSNKARFHAKPPSRQEKSRNEDYEDYSGSPLTTRVMPSLISATLKLTSKPKRLSAGRSLGEKLLLVHRRNHLDRLDLHDHQVLNDRVCPKSHLNVDAVLQQPCYTSRDTPGEPVADAS